MTDPEIQPGEATDPPKTFEVATVETLHRVYVVQAPDEETAKERVRLFWRDPDVLREGAVVRQAKETVSSRQVRSPETK
jgi:hypothetical protein